MPTAQANGQEIDGERIALGSIHDPLLDCAGGHRAGLRQDIFAELTESDDPIPDDTDRRLIRPRRAQKTARESGGLGRRAAQQHPR